MLRVFCCKSLVVAIRAQGSSRLWDELKGWEMDKVKQEWCCVSKAMAAHQSWFLDQDQEKKILSESPLTSTSKKKKKKENTIP